MCCFELETQMEAHSFIVKQMLVICCTDHGSGHADGIYIPFVGYVSFYKPYIPAAVLSPVQSGHSDRRKEANILLTHITHACIT